MLLPYQNYIIIYSKAKNNFQMLYEKQTSKIPKKTCQKLSKFSYYVDTYFPELFELRAKSLDVQKRVERPMNRLLTKVSNRGINYNYFYSKGQNSAAIDSNSILGSVKKLYLNQDVIKINEMSYSRQNIIKQSYLPVYGYFSEIIDFILIADKQEKPQHNQKSKEQSTSNLANHTNTQGKSAANHNSKTLKTANHPKQYWLYVVHNCNSFKTQSEDIKKISWEHFIERYHFVDKNTNDGSGLGTVQYELVFSSKQQSSFFSFQQKLTKVFVESHCKLVNLDTLYNLQKLQGYLLQRSSEVVANKKRQQDVAFSDQHRRQLKVPVEHFKHYMTLKKQVYKYYLDLHGCQSEEHMNKYYYENLICRYLIAKEYHFEQAKKAILEYLQWQKKLVQKYPSLDSFKEYHQLGAYRYVGEDYMGRPILLSKSALIDVNKLPDVEKYCDYYIYFIQIYLRSKMRGYVDQMVVIGDLNNLSSSNFKLAITKRNLADSLKYGPQRQYALITVNVSTFAYTAWNFIKPLMPKKTLHKIQIVGHDKKQIVKTLSTRMDISVIPEYLGGQNKKFQQSFSLEKENEYEFSKSLKSRTIIDKLDMQEDDLQDVQIASVQSVIVQNKKSQNGLFNLFQSVTKTFGIKLGD